MKTPKLAKAKSWQNLTALSFLFVVLLSSCANNEVVNGDVDPSAEGLSTFQVQLVGVTAQSVSGDTQARVEGLPISGPTLSLATNPLAKLRLTAICNGRWRVRNTNTVAVPFIWDVYRTSENGGGLVTAGTDVFFTTSTGSKTVRLFVNGKQVDVKASNSTPCP